jgi:hypothetical protein
MKKYYLVDELHVLSQTDAKSLKDATKHFKKEGWKTGEVMTEDDFVIELELNAYENMSHEY